MTGLFLDKKQKKTYKKMVEKLKIKNLIEMVDQPLTQELLEKITEGKKVVVSIVNLPSIGKDLQWNGKCMFIFDVCRAGNERYNVISVVRDLLTYYYAMSQWTRKNVEELLDFGSSSMQEPEIKKPIN